MGRYPKGGTRAADDIDRLAVKIVSLVVDRVDRNGILEAYDGIEAARDIRALLLKKFSRQTLKKTRAAR